MLWTDVDTSVKTLKLKGSSVPDSNGSPMNVSAILNYRIIDGIAATYNIENFHEYVENQALEVLRRVCSQFPYRSKGYEPSLMTDSKQIGAFMKDLVQERCDIVGITIIRMELMEIAYHVEVAQSLLQVQQAQAKIDARQLIVQGSVSIVHGALQNLQEKGIDLEKHEQNDLVKKLMIITCSDHGTATPVFNI